MRKVATVQPLMSALLILIKPGRSHCRAGFCSAQTGSSCSYDSYRRHQSCQTDKDKKDDGIIVVQESKPIVQTAKGWQTLLITSTSSKGRTLHH